MMGKEGEGWKVAMATLMFERGACGWSGRWPSDDGSEHRRHCGACPSRQTKR
jgi:hypothetical protein